jgi:hypothetical protein
MPNVVFGSEIFVLLYGLTFIKRGDSAVQVDDQFDGRVYYTTVPTIGPEHIASMLYTTSPLLRDTCNLSLL